jgi:predicted  nucleic acid-binding Zn-ribbon protein
MKDTPIPREEFEEWLETFYDNSNILSPRSLAWEAWQAAQKELTAAREELAELNEEYGTWWAQKRIAIDELKDVTEQRDRLAEALESIVGESAYEGLPELKQQAIEEALQSLNTNEP